MDRPRSGKRKLSLPTWYLQAERQLDSLSNYEGEPMAEAMVVVCDTCGKPAEKSVTFRLDGRNLQKDLCGNHVAELVKGARPPRRGRRPGSVIASSSRGPSKASAPRKRAARKASARKGSAQKTSARKKPAARKRRGTKS
jgi:hypothetical protein